MAVDSLPRLPHVRTISRLTLTAPPILWPCNPRGQTTVAFALEDLDSDSTTKPELVVLAVNHDGTAAGSDYRLHYFTQGPGNTYAERHGSDNPLLAVELCGAATCNRSPPCCTALTFAGRCMGGSVAEIGAVVSFFSCFFFLAAEVGGGRGACGSKVARLSIVNSCVCPAAFCVARPLPAILAKRVTDYDNDGRSVRCDVHRVLAARVQSAPWMTRLAPC